MPTTETRIDISARPLHVHRHDQLKAAAAAQLAAELEERGNNNGFSSAYDSVFHGPQSDEVSAQRVPE